MGPGRHRPAGAAGAPARRRQQSLSPGRGAPAGRSLQSCPQTGARSQRGTGQARRGSRGTFWGGRVESGRGSRGARGAAPAAGTGARARAGAARGRAPRRAPAPAAAPLERRLDLVVAAPDHDRGVAPEAGDLGRGRRRRRERQGQQRPGAWLKARALQARARAASLKPPTLSPPAPPPAAPPRGGRCQERPGPGGRARTQRLGGGGRLVGGRGWGGRSLGAHRAGGAAARGCGYRAPARAATSGGALRPGRPPAAHRPPAWRFQGGGEGRARGKGGVSRGGSFCRPTGRAAGRGRGPPAKHRAATATRRHPASPASPDHEPPLVGVVIELVHGVNAAAPHADLGGRGGGGGQGGIGRDRAPLMRNAAFNPLSPQPPNLPPPPPPNTRPQPPPRLPQAPQPCSCVPPGRRPSARAGPRPSRWCAARWPG
jgi:hypothetical protein